MKNIFTLILFLLVTVLTSCQNSNIQAIYGTWERINDASGKKTIVTFSEKTWREGNGQELATNYKEIKDGVIAIYYNGDEYAYIKITDKGMMNFALKANPKAVASFRKIN